MNNFYKIDEGADDASTPTFLTTYQKNIFNSLWGSSFVGLALLDRGGKFLRANLEFCELIEYSEIELQKKHCTDITHPEDQETDLILSNRALRGELKDYVVFKRVITKTGSIRTLHVRVLAIFDKSNFKFFIAQSIQVAPRKQVLPAIPRQVKEKIKLPAKMTLIGGWVVWFITELLRQLKEANIF